MRLLPRLVALAGLALGLVLIAPACETSGQLKSASPSASGATVHDRAHVADTIRVGRATAAAYGMGSVWVSLSAEHGGSVLRIDPRTTEVREKIAVPVAPDWEVGGGGLVVTLGSVWVGGRGPGDEGTIARIDGRTNRVADTFTLHEGAVADLAVNEQGIWALLSGSAEETQVVRIDPASGEKVGRIPLVGGEGRFIVSAQDSILAAIRKGPGGGTLMRIDPATNRVDGTFDLGTYPSLAYGEGEAWVVTGDGLVRIESSTGRPAGATADVFSTGDALAVGSDGVWILNPRKNRAVSRVNPADGEIDLSVRPVKDATPIAIAVAPGSVWVVNYENSLTRIDLR
ncbi:MAG: hypothetical protein WD276_00715 [Actinomycetota bacterium]